MHHFATKIRNYLKIFHQSAEAFVQTSRPHDDVYTNSRFSVFDANISALMEKCKSKKLPTSILRKCYETLCVATKSIIFVNYCLNASFCYFMYKGYVEHVLGNQTLNKVSYDQLIRIQFWAPGR